MTRMDTATPEGSSVARSATTGKSSPSDAAARATTSRTPPRSPNTWAYRHQLLGLRPEGFPWIKVNGRELTGTTVLDLDASVIPAHSDKEGAEANFKGYGHHPLLMFCDNTEELLVNRLRPGSAGSNTADDHIEGVSRVCGSCPPDGAAASCSAPTVRAPPRSSSPGSPAAAATPTSARSTPSDTPGTRTSGQPWPRSPRRHGHRPWTPTLLPIRSA
ncbi:transposase [Streptomyces sp. NBC_01537]|uniref:transposase n=1 Tax=Streptomyces sp. NBC_01537 TaxID=2903896 RepID=UPI0038646DC3